MASPAALSAHDLHKRYAAVQACDGVDLSIAPGEIRALLGENGAGKSTLMGMLYGLIRPDAGHMKANGVPYAPRSPRDGIDAGIGMVHQELMLVPSLTVAENVVLGIEPRRRGLLDQRAARAMTRDTAHRFGLEIDPRARVADLPIGLRQRVEILKILHRDARILILDEPTAVLDPTERDSLFDVLRALADDGRAILFITHKLDEVSMLANRATILRHGRVVATVPVPGTSPETLCEHMIGHATNPVVGDRKPKVCPSDAAPVVDMRVLDVRGLTVASRTVTGHHRPARLRVRNIDLEVHAGEIVGIAGVAGNGQRALVDAIAGLHAPTSGSVHLRGGNDTLRDVTTASLADRRRAGLAWIAEDRAGRGLATGASIADNLLIGVRESAVVFPRGVRARGHARAHVARLLARLGIRVVDPAQPARTLSGGNQQKLVAAREIDVVPRVLLAEQPSRGVDVAATAVLHNHLRGACAEGAGILLVSSEIDEILALSHRILVMRNGRLVGTLAANEATETRIGLLMTGAAA